jgi:aspartate aminotransferase-like enzyme
MSLQLRIPGPTAVPDRVVRAAARPMLNPRGPEFAALLRECADGVRWALQTTNDVLFFPASGTGGLEAAVANLLSPGERVLFCTSGWFGELWADIARVYGADVLCLRSPCGRPVDPAAVERALDANPEIAKVFVTHNETSTGVVADVAALAAVVKARGCLLAVDSVSGAPCHPLPVDALALDVVVSACQKGWLAPPGLTMIAVSDAALQAAERSRCPSWYFDFGRQRAALAHSRMLTTPPVSVMFALQEGLAMLREEGLGALWLRHDRVARSLRSGLRALALQTVARPGCASSTVTTVRSPYRRPERLAALLHDLRTHHGLILADALGELEGRAFRIGHLGAITEADTAAVLTALTAEICISASAA